MDIRFLKRRIALSYYWGKFELRNKDLFRLDTRIYLKPILKPSSNDLCIGAVVGKNPGSAKPSDHNSTSLQKIELDKDKLLSNIRSILIKAYQMAKEPIPENSYVQMLNLLYVCDIKPEQAIKKVEKHNHLIICDTEEHTFPFLWYVWGSSNKKLNFYKPRIFNIKSDMHFYLNTNTNEVINTPPQIDDAARHTQGLKHDLIVPFISKIL